MSACVDLFCYFSVGVIWGGTLVPNVLIDRTTQIWTESQEYTEILQSHANHFCISYPYNLQRETKQEKKISWRWKSLRTAMIADRENKKSFLFFFFLFFNNFLVYIFIYVFIKSDKCHHSIGIYVAH